jgi:hypothetical protein
VRVTQLRPILSELKISQSGGALVNRLATALRVTLAELFGPFDRRFRSRARKARNDLPA